MTHQNNEELHMDNNKPKEMSTTIKAATGKNHPQVLIKNQINLLENFQHKSLTTRYNEQKYK